MLTDDKARAGGNKSLKDNVNTRDQRRAGIVLLVLTGIFLAFLIALGLSHAPQQHAAETPAGAEATGHASTDHHFDINRPVGFLELPGTIGKPQRPQTTGVGNTPAPFTVSPKPSVSLEKSPAPAAPAAAGH